MLTIAVGNGRQI